MNRKSIFMLFLVKGATFGPGAVGCGPPTTRSRSCVWSFYLCLLDGLFRSVSRRQQPELLGAEGGRCSWWVGTVRWFLFPSMLCCGADNLWFLGSKVELFVSKQKNDVWWFGSLFWFVSNPKYRFSFSCLCFLWKCTWPTCWCFIRNPLICYRSNVQDDSQLPSHQTLAQYL